VKVDKTHPLSDAKIHNPSIVKRKCKPKTITMIAAAGEKTNRDNGKIVATFTR
jgi:hypothetical protein